MKAWFTLLRLTLAIEWAYWFWPGRDDEWDDEIRTAANAGWFKLFQWVRE